MKGLGQGWAGWVSCFPSEPVRLFDLWTFISLDNNKKRTLERQKTD